MLAYILSSTQIFLSCLFVNLLIYRHICASIEDQATEMRQSAESALRHTSDCFMAETSAASDRVRSLSATVEGTRSKIDELEKAFCATPAGLGDEQIRTVVLPDFCVSAENFRLFVEHDMPAGHAFEDIVAISACVIDKDGDQLSSVNASTSVHRQKIVIADPAMALAKGSVVRCVLQTMARTMAQT
jgi:hypothetical protein